MIHNILWYLRKITLQTAFYVVLSICILEERTDISSFGIGILREIPLVFPNCERVPPPRYGFPLTPRRVHGIIPLQLSLMCRANCFYSSGSTRVLSFFYFRRNIGAPENHGILFLGRNNSTLFYIN